MKPGLLGYINSRPHGVAHIRVSPGVVGEVDEFFGVFYCGGLVSQRFDVHSEAMQVFDDLCKEGRL